MRNLFQNQIHSKEYSCFINIVTVECILHTESIHQFCCCWQLPMSTHWYQQQRLWSPPPWLCTNVRIILSLPVWIISHRWPIIPACRFLLRLRSWLLRAGLLYFGFSNLFHFVSGFGGGIQTVSCRMQTSVRKSIFRFVLANRPILCWGSWSKARKILFEISAREDLYNKVWKFFFCLLGFRFLVFLFFGFMLFVFLVCFCFLSDWPTEPIIKRLSPLCGLFQGDRHDHMSFNIKTISKHLQWWLIDTCHWHFVRRNRGQRMEFAQVLLVRPLTAVLFVLRGFFSGF